MLAVFIMLAAQGAAHVCDLGSIKTASATHTALGERAVMIVANASANDPAVDALVDRHAVVNLGAGDVERPLGTGMEGIRAMANTMEADEFKFFGWGYMDGPAEACGKQSVTVDFINSADRRVSQVEFTFDKGRITKAQGWERSFEGGSLSALRRTGNGS